MHKQNFIARLVNQWFDRVMGALSEGSLSDQKEEYAAHRTARDSVLGARVGVGAWGMVFPILTIIATQLVGAEQAGMFSMAFDAGTPPMILANFGVRTYQVSDVNEKHTFMDYQINRWITCVVMVAVGAIYCQIRGYDSTMFYISIGVYLYRMVDGLADVYEGRLQQVDKLYLAGVSQALRSVAGTRRVLDTAAHHAQHDRRLYRYGYRCGGNLRGGHLPAHALGDAEGALMECGLYRAALQELRTALRGALPRCGHR